MLGGSPTWKHSGFIRYDTELNADMDSFVALNGRYVGEVQIDRADDPRTTIDLYPSYALFDLRAGVDWGRISASVWVENVANKRSRVSQQFDRVLGGRLFYTRPRTVGSIYRMSFSLCAKLGLPTGLACFAALFVVGASASETACTTTRNTFFDWSVCEDNSIWVIETKQPLSGFFISANVPTFREKIVASPQFAAIVNGAYHNGNYSAPLMEGLLTISGNEISKIKINDQQLTHIMCIDAKGKIVGILPASALPDEYPQPDYTYTQSGPLILNRGEIALSSITTSLNGAGAYKRTAIGVTEAGDTVIIIAKTPRTLPELGRIVLGIGNYRKRRLTLLNFDGGPSTAAHSLENGSLTYGADKVTPVGFGILK